jgi:PAB1-binding protein PBP1
VLTTYDELHYTTHLNPDVIPQQIKTKAEKIVKDILEGDSNNIHIKEERGLIPQTEEDEEGKYSSVIRE